MCQRRFAATGVRLPRNAVRLPAGINVYLHCNPQPRDQPRREGSNDLRVEYTQVMTDLGRILVMLGGLILLLGLVLILAGKINLPIGRMPGDIVVRGKHSTFYFPLMTSIVLSILLSLVLYFVNRMRR